MNPTLRRTAARAVHRLLAIVPAACLLAAAPAASALDEPPAAPAAPAAATPTVDEVRSALERYVETRRIISKERLEFAKAKQGRMLLQADTCERRMLLASSRATSACPSKPGTAMLVMLQTRDPPPFTRATGIRRNSSDSRKSLIARVRRTNPRIVAIR